MSAGAALARPRQVAVIGSSGCAPDSELWGLAEEVGRGLAGAGVTVVCGGGPGVMEAAAKGSGEAGGRVIGILQGDLVADSNPYCTEVVASGIGHARNLAVVASGEAVIAVGGEWGTLSEIGLARTIGRTVVALRSWELSGYQRTRGAPGVVPAETAAEAVAAALAALG
ncbi:MAG: LOG family protein [Solirubrobacterales bacterium]